MPKKLDLTGKIFGLVRCDSQAPSKSGKTYWNCSCIKCGMTKVIQGSHLTSGATKTCGCECQLDGITTMNQKKICEICGKEFTIINHGWVRKFCYECSPKIDDNCTNAQQITIKRRALKEMLIQYKGGKCERCGYNKCNRALEFHHLDPTKKDFGVSQNINRNINDLKAEVDKCILLCSNCHAEVHQELYEQGLLNE